jgi:hypothetical protein
VQHCMKEAQHAVVPFGLPQHAGAVDGQQVPVGPKGPKQHIDPEGQQVTGVPEGPGQHVDPVGQHVGAAVGELKQQVTGPGPGQQVTLCTGKKLTHSLVMSLLQSLQACMHSACAAPWKLAQNAAQGLTSALALPRPMAASTAPPTPPAISFSARRLDTPLAKALDTSSRVVVIGVSFLAFNGR